MSMIEAIQVVEVATTQFQAAAYVLRDHATRAVGWLRKNSWAINISVRTCGNTTKVQFGRLRFEWRVVSKEWANTCDHADAIAQQGFTIYGGLCDE